jgi:hypothetical protein
MSRNAFVQIADFLEVDLTPEELTVIAERSSFAWMKVLRCAIDVG